MKHAALVQEFRDDRVFKVLVDPEAVNSYINTGTAKFYDQKGWPIKQERKTAAMADGTPAMLKKSLNGTTAIIGRTIEHSFPVMERLTHDILLGMDI